MTVVFKGGTSGNRQNGLPNVPDSGVSQPIIDTDTSGAVPSSIQFPSGRPHRHGQDRTAEFMPTGATIPQGSEDVCQQDVEKQYGGLPKDSGNPNGY